MTLRAGLALGPSGGAVSTGAWPARARAPATAPAARTHVTTSASLAASSRRPGRRGAAATRGRPDGPRRCTKAGLPNGGGVLATKLVLSEYGTHQEGGLGRGTAPDDRRRHGLARRGRRPRRGRLPSPSCRASAPGSALPPRAIGPLKLRATQRKCAHRGRLGAHSQMRQDPADTCGKVRQVRPARPHQI